VDNGSCTASWENGSEQFRQATTSGLWCQAVTSARTPFGKLLSRKLVAETQSLSLPGAPDGEYVVMRFASSFEKKSEGVETVTFSRERDGVWRAAGYFVK
jgi:serine/threonine-protein kinase